MEIFTPKERIYGRSYSDWIIRWWQHKEEPHASPVFLLVADYDGTMDYSIYVPLHTMAMLMSPINYIAIKQDDNDNRTKMINRCREEIDIIDKKKIKTQFDGEEVGHLAQRVATGFFPTYNGLAIADGYWLFLKGPFNEGKREITSFGTCRSGQIQLSAKTELVFA